MRARRCTWPETSANTFCIDSSVSPGIRAFSQAGGCFCCSYLDVNPHTCKHVSHHRRWFLPDSMEEVAFAHALRRGHAMQSVPEISSASGHNIGRGDSQDGVVLISRAADTSQTPPDARARREQGGGEPRSTKWSLGWK